jgi:uncharacterized caspase-like protein
VRTKARFFLAISMACFIYSAQSLGAEAPRYALVIGNAAYSQDAALKNPVNDATDVAASLKAVGWNVALVTNADHRAFIHAVADFRDALAAHEGADALFFYAGHGMQVDGINYLIPVKTEFDTLDDIKSDAMSIQFVTDAIAQGKANISLLILDACRDNPFAKKVSRSLGGARGLTVVQTGGGVAGSAIMFSTSPGDVALDGDGRNGIFTGALLNYIASDLKIEDLFKKVTSDVRKQSAGTQNPWINASLSSDFFFISDAMRSAKAEETAKAAESVKQAEIAKATAAASEQAKKAQIEAEAAKKAAAAALAAKAETDAKMAAEQNRPKGKVRIESSASGQVFVNNQLLGDVSPDYPLMADNLPTGKQDFRFAVKGQPDETKTASLTDKAYVTVTFGKAQPANLASYPGSISVAVGIDGAFASLDDQEEVALPHVFEYLTPGEHKVAIKGMRAPKIFYSSNSEEINETKIYPGIEEIVMVESGKQVKLRPDFLPGKARIRITGILPESTIYVDGEERPSPQVAEGNMTYEGDVDSGDVRVEIIRKNIRWDTIFVPGFYFERKLEDMHKLVTLQKIGIKMNGKKEDFVAVEPVYRNASHDANGGPSASLIAGGSICRDEKNLYIKIDVFTDKAVWGSGGCRMLKLQQDGKDYDLQAAMWDDGVLHAAIYDAVKKTTTEVGSIAQGPSCVELKFPLSQLSKDFDFSKPIDARFCYWSKSGKEYNETPLVSVLIGK